MERAAQELEKSGRRGHSCFAIMDIDHFKNFNDTYGHLAGDETLRHVVQVVSAGLRKNDFLGRYGGEEFTFFFSNADEELGLLVAERLRTALETSPVMLENGPVQVTASFGIAESGDSIHYEEMESSREISAGMKWVQRIINNADKAMYSAKRSGRNKVAAYRPDLRDIPEETGLTGRVAAQAAKGDT
jgi:diguanylate cyclase (GGDEF)-like protein